MMEDESLPDDMALAEWFRSRTQRIHQRFNPFFGPHYDTTSGVQFRMRDAFAYTTIQRAKAAPLAITGTMLMSPSVTSEVVDVGGAQTFYATPSSSSGLLGMMAYIFDWED